MLAVSGEECVAALLAGGFRPLRREEGTSVVERGYRVARIPDALVLSPEDLDEILRSAGVAYTQFLELLSAAFPIEGEPAAMTGVRPALPAGEAGDALRVIRMRMRRPAAR
jgi:hypothetical protein